MMMMVLWVTLALDRLGWTSEWRYCTINLSTTSMKLQLSFWSVDAVNEIEYEQKTGGHCKNAREYGQRLKFMIIN